MSVVDWRETHEAAQRARNKAGQAQLHLTDAQGLAEHQQDNQVQTRCAVMALVEARGWCQDALDELARAGVNIEEAQ